MEDAPLLRQKLTAKLKMHMKRCQICNVSSFRKGDKKRIFMAKFPLDEVRCKQWVKATGNEDLAYVPIEKLHQLKYVCENHFKPKDFSKNRTHLRRTAIPSLNIAAKPLSDEVLKDFPLHIASDRLKELSYKKALISYRQSLPIVHREHDYCPTYSMLNFEPSTSESPTALDANKSPHVDFLSAYNYTAPTNDIDDNHDDNLENPCSPKPSTSTSDPKPKNVTQDNPTSLESKSESNEQLMTPSQIRKLQKKFEKINSQIKILKKKDRLINNISSPVLKSFIESSITNNNRKPHGKRWTELNKTVALMIYKKSPKVYKYISQLLPFPSDRTLRVALDHVKINTCVDNSNIINSMKKRVECLSNNDKICVILFNKMPLKKRLLYNTTTDKIDGYEDLGSDQRSPNIADHALVTMLQSVHKNMKHPIGHYFFKGTIQIEKLANIIEKNIRAMIEVGYNIIATVCDHGATNVAALNLLRTWGNSTESNYFFIDDKKIFIIYDVPHLFKSIRNNFHQAGEIIIDNKKGKWDHLMLVEKANQTSLHFQKITKLHVKPTFKSKMKLSHAVQTLSNTVAGILKLLALSIHHQDVSGEILQTAEVIESLDQLFDCTNGPSSKSDTKTNRRENVRKNSFHHQLWIEYKRKLRDLKFINLDNRFLLKNARCINGYRITLSSLQDIWNYMDSRNIECLNLRRLNLDALEKFFDMIKQYCPPFNNPNSHQFTSAFRSSMLTHITATLGKEGDGEEGDNESLLDFQKLIFPKDGNSEKEVKAEEMLDIQKVFKDLDKQPIVYVSGYLASVLLKYEPCQRCINSIKISNPEMNTMYDCNALRDWWKNKPSLTYPTEELCRTVDKAINIFETTVQPNIYVKDILDTCKTEIQTKSDFSWLCEEHKDIMTQKLLRRISLLLFRNHCQIINKLLMTEKQLSTHLLESENNIVVENECEISNTKEPIAEFTVYYMPNDCEN